MPLAHDPFHHIPSAQPKRTHLLGRDENVVQVCRKFRSASRRKPNPFPRSPAFPARWGGLRNRGSSLLGRLFAASVAVSAVPRLPHRLRPPCSLFSSLSPSSAGGRGPRSPGPDSAAGVSGFFSAGAGGAVDCGAAGRGPGFPAGSAGGACASPEGDADAPSPRLGLFPRGRAALRGGLAGGISSGWGRGLMLETPGRRQTGFSGFPTCIAFRCSCWFRRGWGLGSACRRGKRFKFFFAHGRCLLKKGRREQVVENRKM